jgi:hypothetical protein
MAMKELYKLHENEGLESASLHGNDDAVISFRSKDRLKSRAIAEDYLSILQDIDSSLGI